MMVFAIAIGGSLGAIMRYYAGVLMEFLVGNHFPYATLFVNVLGSFLIGILVEILALKFNNSMELRAFLITGCLGAFTTFSTFSLDILKLIDSQQYVQALSYVVASILLSLIAIFSAVYMARGFIG